MDHIPPPLSLSFDTFHSPDPSSPNFLALLTNFNLNASKNRKIPYPQGEDKVAEKLAHTERQRMYATNALEPKDSEDFVNMVCILLSIFETN
jgi:hypothetical protein